MRPRPRPTAVADRYGLLLLLLVSNFLLSAFAGGDSIAFVRVVSFAATLHLALRTSRVRRPVARGIIVAVALGSAGTVALVASHRLAIALGVLNAWVALVLLVTVLAILRRVLSHTVVSGQTILGALSAYIVIGLMFAAVYGALSQLDPRPFFAQTPQATSDLLQYFSFTTLTTTGYGDVTAATNSGRAFAMLEALTGQIFLVTLVARLVSTFAPTGRRRRRTGPSAQTGAGQVSAGTTPRGRPRRRPDVRQAPRRRPH